MTTLNLGVIDVPYDDRSGVGGSKGEPTTTVSVATLLEEKYGVMGAFYEAHKQDITQSLVSSVEGALEDLFANGWIGDPFAEAGQAIQTEFRTFLMTGEIEKMGIPGVPTKASVERRSLRFKDKVSSGPRPSFIDTSLYEMSMVAWVEQ